MQEWWAGNGSETKDSPHLECVMGFSNEPGWLHSEQSSGAAGRVVVLT